MLVKFDWVPQTPWVIALPTTAVIPVHHPLPIDFHIDFIYDLINFVVAVVFDTTKPTMNNILRDFLI